MEAAGRGNGKVYCPRHRRAGSTSSPIACVCAKRLGPGQHEVEAGEAELAELLQSLDDDLGRSGYLVVGGATGGIDAHRDVVDAAHCIGLAAHITALNHRRTTRWLVFFAVCWCGPVFDLSGTMLLWHEDFPAGLSGDVGADAGAG